MCPIPPILSAETSDEKVVIFLESRKIDDPIPSNVIADVDPFTIDPQLSSGNDWYMYKSMVLDINDERSIIKGKSGYWELMNDISIPTSSPTIGRKITRKFYLGTKIFGEKTAFRMHEYYIEHEEKNKFKDTSLSRIFTQIDELNNEECDTSGENTESKLPYLENQQERNSSPKQCENEFQVSKENEGQSELKNNEVNVEEPGFENFIELKDLFDPEDGNSSFSDNTSSAKSMTSDEHFESEIMGFDPEAMTRFDPEAMTKEIANDVNTSVSSDPVVIQPPLSFDSPVPRVVERSKSEESTSSSSESSGDSTSAKYSGNGSSCKRTKSRSARRRMAKLGKRYCCFS